MTRPWRTTAVGLALTALLGGCVGGGGVTDNPFVQKGQTQASPSGKYTASLRASSDKGFTEYRPIITDASGTPVWENQTAFVERYFPGVTWAKDSDTLWVLSTDVGNSRVELKAGAWVQTFGNDGMPEFLQKWVRS